MRSKIRTDSPIISLLRIMTVFLKILFVVVCFVDAFSLPTPCIPVTGDGLQFLCCVDVILWNGFHSIYMEF